MIIKTEPLRDLNDKEARNDDLEAIFGIDGCNCSKIVFDNSIWQPEVTAGVLREQATEVLRAYFSKHQKG